MEGDLIMQRTLVVYGDQTLGNSIAGVLMNENMKRLQNRLDKQTELANRNADYRHLDKQKRWKDLERRKKIMLNKHSRLSDGMAMMICLFCYALPEYIHRRRMRYFKMKRRKARRNYH